MKKYLLPACCPVLLFSLLLFSCRTADQSRETLGSVEQIDPSLGDLLDPTARPEVLAEGYEWSEGPLWVESEGMLLFSDVPTNTVYKWTEENGAEVYLKPSGYTGQSDSNSKEEGSNGLAVSPEGKLVLCQHGDRRLAVMESSMDDPKPEFTSIADAYEGKRFNSPNDVAIRSNGDYFFTDPPYGLPQNLSQDIPFQGVYLVSGGKVKLLVDSITRPNGIALMPDERTLIIANSDKEKARWYAYDLTDNDSLVNGRIFYDVTEAAKTAAGLPDGLKIDKQGNVFATGPGGVWIFSKGGKLLGKINVPAATANCAFSGDGKMLYLTADSYILRVRMK